MFFILKIIYQLNGYYIYMIVYKATNTLNNKTYIGITKQELRFRKYRHVYDSKTSKFYFHNAIRKYGQENFTWEIIDRASSIEELLELEKKYIEQLKPEYNMVAGGRGMLNPSDETRRRLSEAHKNRFFSEEHRERISKAKKGKKLSKEHKEALSKAKLGKKFSEEHRRKISEGNIRRWANR